MEPMGKGFRLDRVVCLPDYRSYNREHLGILFIILPTPRVSAELCYVLFQDFWFRGWFNKGA